jgi:hypothetical protein
MGENGSTNVWIKLEHFTVDKLLYMQLSCEVKLMSVPIQPALELFIYVQTNVNYVPFEKVLWISIVFSADPDLDPSFLVNVESDQGFRWQEIKKNVQLKTYFLDQKFKFFIPGPS